jgi:amino acid transporter
MAQPSAPTQTTAAQRPAQAGPTPSGPQHDGASGAPGAPAGGLRGKLGLWSIVFMVVAAASPLGVIGGPVPLGIAIGNGAAFPATFVIAAVVLALFAVGFTAMTPHVRKAGAFSSYVREGLGAGAGVGTGFAALLTYLTLEAAVYGLIGPGIQELLASYGVPSIPWWAWALLVAAGVAALGYRNIAVSGKVLAILLIAEVAIVVILDVAVIASGSGPEGPSTAAFQPSQIFSGAPGVAILFALLSFLGFEATAVFRDETKDPRRTIPRATFVALGGVAVFYAVSSWVLVTAVGESTVAAVAAENSATLLSDVTGTYLGPIGVHVQQVLYVTSLLACILAVHHVGARYLFSLGQDGILSPSLGVVQPKHGSPARASLVASAVSVALIALAAVAQLDPIAEYYTWVAGFSSVGLVVLLGLTTVAVLRYFGTHPGLVGRFKGLVAPALALLGLAIFAVLVVINLPLLVGEALWLQILILGGHVIGFALGYWLGVRRAKAHAAA